MRTIHCLQFSGAPLDNGIRDVLYLAACKMIGDRKGRMTFKDENAEGIIETAGKRRTVTSAMRGIEFTAQIDCTNGTSLVCKFLVDDVNMMPEEDVIEGLMGWYVGYPNRDAR